MCSTFASKEIRTEDYVNSDDDWVRPVISTLEQLLLRGALSMGVKVSKNQIPTKSNSKINFYTV